MLIKNIVNKTPKHKVVKKINSDLNYLQLIPLSFFTTGIYIVELLTKSSLNKINNDEIESNMSGVAEDFFISDFNHV
jgi:hypothetical protein